MSALCLKRWLTQVSVVPLQQRGAFDEVRHVDGT
jgi:hypothetical protein